MIIRRIAKGIKEQDWFVVSIEVLIVVVGIFLGMQVTDWNDERKAQDAEIEKLRALQREIQTLVHWGNFMEERLSTSNIYNSVNAAIDAIYSGEMGELTDEEIAAELWRLNLPGFQSPNSVVIDRFMEENFIQDLSDEELSSQLWYFLRQFKYVRDLTHINRRDYPLTPVNHDVFYYVNDPEKDDRTRLSIDFERATQSQQFKNAVSHERRLNYARKLTKERLYKLAAEVCEALSYKTAVPCTGGQGRFKRNSE